MFNYNPRIDYTNYQMRRCGQSWQYCDGKCDKCNIHNYTTSNHTTLIPGGSTTTNYTEFYHTKKYDYTVDYTHRDTLTIPETTMVNSNSKSRDYSSNVLLGIDHDTYCQMVGPWSYYRTMYGWISNI